MAYDTRNGGLGAPSPPVSYPRGGNPQPRNPGPDRVTCDPRSPPSPGQGTDARVAGRPRINPDQFPASIPPGAGPNRGLKPLT